jgi:hypothetical protein
MFRARSLCSGGSKLAAIIFERTEIAFAVAAQATETLDAAVVGSARSEKVLSDSAPGVESSSPERGERRLESTLSRARITAAIASSPRVVR